MGGMSVGSISALAREKQQEGLMMPPMKLIEGGVLRERRVAADPQHDPPAADGRARPARLHRLERRRARRGCAS